MIYQSIIIIMGLITILAAAVWANHSPRTCIPYSRKISRAKIFEVDLPQNISQIKFRGSTRLSLHLYTIIRFSRINFRGSCEIHENNEIYCPQKIPAIQYIISLNMKPSWLTWISTWQNTALVNNLTHLAISIT